MISTGGHISNLIAADYFIAAGYYFVCLDILVLKYSSEKFCVI
jgi:hypothetical protein